MLTLADGRTRVDVTLTKPTGYDDGDGVFEVTIAELGTLIDASDQINKPDYNLSPTASDTVPDQPLSREGNATTFGASNFAGSITVLRSLDADGQVDAATDTLYTAIGEKGVLAYYIERVGPKSGVALAVGDTGFIYEAISDEPQVPQDRAGYVKNVIPLGVQSRRAFSIVAA